MAVTETIIRRDDRWVRIPWRELWDYRDLLLILVRRDFLARYRQTVLGPVWAILQPLLISVVLTVIFARVVGVPTNNVPPMLFYLCGMLAWNYFAQTFQHTSNTFIGYAGIFGKVYFPRLVVPLAAAAANLIGFVLQAIPVVIFWIYYKTVPWASGGFGLQWQVVLLPFLVLQIAALGMGCGLWMASITAKYRDLQQLTGFLVQLWMYATPLIYPLSQIPEHWRWAFALNPMTMPVEGMRHMLLGTGIMAGQYWALSAVVTLLLLAGALVVFSRVEKTAVDSV